MRRKSRTHEARRERAELGAHGARGSTRTARALAAASSRRLAVALALTGCLVTLATALATIAQGEPACEPKEQCREANELISGRKHQERTYGQQVAGAPHPETTPIEGSATPFEADLFAVRARNAREALAGGATCEDEVSLEEVESCERVPMIYATDEDNPWHEAYRSDRPGYVGAIAWIGRGKALAVGGTGAYPRREFNEPGDGWGYEKRVAHDLEEGAGDARAWYFHDGAWEEITDTLPEEMGGLSALDVWIGREEDGDAWGLAGDYGHIWEWEGGRFTGQHIDRDSPSAGAPDAEWAAVNGPVSFSQQCQPGGGPPCSWNPSSETSDASFFHYRVREIRIAPDRTQKRAFAFTAGCCGPQSAGGSRRIEYMHYPRKHETGAHPDQAPPPEQRPHWIVSSRNDYGDSVYSFALQPTRFFRPSAYDEPWPEDNQLIWQVGQTVRAPGGPEQAGEPQERFVASDGDTEPRESVIGDGRPDWLVGETPASGTEPSGLGVLATTVQALQPEYGGIRPHCTRTLQTAGINAAEEVFVDLSPLFFADAQGTIKSTRVCRVEQIQAGQQPSLDSEGPLRTKESGVQVGPSWAVNAIDMPDNGAFGYAVGDRGAILRFDAPPAESDPPSLGARRPARLAERSAYDAARPAPAGKVGEVPALASQPREQLQDPRLARAGSPDGNEIGLDLPVEDVHTIVMGRDGSEGWAIGPSPEARGGQDIGGVMTLYRYEAGQWTRCDPVGIPGIVEPDPACSELAPLYRFAESGGTVSRRIKLDVAARVPLENDSDPSNDDEFEVLAVGSAFEKATMKSGQPHWIPTVIRYRDGRWRLEDFEVRRSLNSDEAGLTQGFALTATSLACSGRDECWLTGRTGGTSGGVVLRRFDGERWIDCTRRQNQPTNAPLVNRGRCGDAANRLTRVSFAVPGGTLAPGRASLTVASAGERVYLGAIRLLASGGVSGDDDVGQGAPVILYKDHGPDEQWQAEGGGYDPGFDDPDADRGNVVSLSVAQRPDGRYEGWAVGTFAGTRPLNGWPLMRLDPAIERWGLWRVRDASYDYLGPSAYSSSPVGRITPSRMLTLPGSGSAPGQAFIGVPPGSPDVALQAPLTLAFNRVRERWELLENPAAARFGHPAGARPMALAPDGRGGIWAAFGTEAETTLPSGSSETYFYNYTQSPPREVFEEVASPLTDPAERLTDLTGSADGSVWVTGDQGALYRHDRLTGWERIAIPGWDPGRVLTHRSTVNAAALGPDGSGLAVGAGGRVAEVSAGQVRLDDAAGKVCKAETLPPCGTSFDLLSVAIAPDGSALVGGEKLTLLWRPANGELRKVEAPDGSPFATVTGVSLPTPDRAWLTLDTGQLYAGTGDGAGNWRWRLENAIDINGVDRLLNEDRHGEPIALRDVAVDAAGHGFAIGDRGVVLERTGEGGEPWRRVDAGVTEKLTSVALPAGEGTGALIGGDRGLVLTLTGGAWRLARAGDQLRPDNGYVAGVALLPGVEEGQVEAWAAVAPQPLDRRRGMSQILHYTNAPQEPLLDPTGNATPLRDVPAPRPGGLSFAAFGRSDCQFGAETTIVRCPPLENGTEPEQTLLRRVREEVLARSREPGGPQFAIWTGDAYDTAGPTAVEPLEQNSRVASHAALLATASPFIPAWTGGEGYRRFNEQITDYLPDRGLPLFGAIGARDLSETRACATDVVANYYCVENRDRPRIGENIAWRQAMEHQPAPWGSGDPAESADLSFEPLRDSGLAIRAEDVMIEDPDGDGGPADDVPVPIGGASTHYAVDVVDRNEVLAIARLVFVDTSGGSLAASDPIQQPLEGEGGQLAWLERVLCIEGSSFDTGQCTREPGQQAIVVSSTPTYSYASTSPTELQADAAVFESILLRHRANVVVSGRLGWNGRYWATAPGVHEPCPGQGYVADEHAPEPGTRVCGQGADGLSTDADKVAGDTQQDALNALGDIAGTGILPFVVASNAGGRFDEFADRSGNATAEDGFWRGYTIVRLDSSGDPRKTIVEQRPIFDWVGISGQEHVLLARERLRLRGVGRGPIAATVGGTGLGSPRFDPISTPAITHRFDLLLADPDEPWRACLASDAACVTLQSRLPVPLVTSGGSSSGASSSGLGSSSSLAPTMAADSASSDNPCDPYLCLPERIGVIDDQSGEVKAGDGKYPDTFAVAMLSVGDHVAAYPLMFKRSPSFVVEPLRLAPPLPAQPQAAPSPPQPPQPPSPPAPNVPQTSVPDVPPPPLVPPLAAASPPEPQPPAPPAPPPPAEQLSPPSLTLAPPGIAIATPTAVIQPPTPPVNPAPPGGARREARQRQAAAQKSGADNAEEAPDIMEGGGDMAEGRPGSSAMTRHDHSFSRRASTETPRRAWEPSFTPLPRSEPSAGAQALLYTGGIALLAAALAAGFTTLRPGPRRREPTAPSPAWSEARRRR